MTAILQAPVRGIRIDIGVCTYRRPELEKTLRSLCALELPAHVTARIVVADNDATPSARELVESMVSELPFEVVYVHCPASNISLARNTCLETAAGDFLAFTDDDGVVAKEWLSALLSVAEETGADAVQGPVLAVYDEKTPDWMRRGDFHSTSPVWVRGEIRTGYSANVLLRRNSPHVIGRRFNLALGRTGGEDTEYFAGMHASGGRIAYAPRALAYEPVPASRTSLGWLIKRRFRSGQTHGRLLGGDRSAAGLVPQMFLAGAKALYCFGAAAITVVLPERRNAYALRGVMHIGVVAGLLGVREIQQYGDSASIGRQGNAA